MELQCFFFGFFLLFFFFPLVTLALSGPEETHTGVVMLGRNISVLCSYQSYCGQEYTQGRSCTGTQVMNVSPCGLSSGGILEGYSDYSLTPLNSILKKWNRFDPQDLKKTHLVFLCDIAWLRYPLEDGEWWPVGGSLKYNTVLQLSWFCRKQGKWVEVAYVLPFFSL